MFLRPMNAHVAMSILGAKDHGNTASKPIRSYQVLETLFPISFESKKCKYAMHR